MFEVFKRRSKIKYSKGMIMILCIMLSFVAAIICLSDIDVPESYVNMYYLPLGHGIIVMFFMYFVLKGEVYDDLPVLVILITLTIRNVVTPMVMVLEKYNSRFGIVNSEKYINIAIISFLLETLFVFMTIILFRQRKKKNRKSLFAPIRFTDNTMYKLVLLGGLALSVMFFIVLPDLKTQYYSIFTQDISNLEHEIIEYSGVKKSLTTASGMIIEATRISLSAWLIATFRKRGENWFTYIMSISVILLQFLFMNDSNAYVIMIALSLYLLIFKLYPKYSGKTIKMLVVIVFLFGLLMYWNRFSKDIYGSSLALFLQAYFPGLANFAVIERLMDRSALDAINQIFIDLYAAVPFRSTLFGYSGGLVDLSTMWNTSNGITGQILPTSAQSYYYFGVLGSPVISMILTVISLSTFEKANSTKNPYLYTALMYMVIYSSTAISMYNLIIFNSGLTTRVAFMLLFTCFSTETFENVLGKADKDSLERSIYKR